MYETLLDILILIEKFYEEFEDEDGRKTIPVEDITEEILTPIAIACKRHLKKDDIYFRRIIS